MHAELRDQVEMWNFRQNWGSPSLVLSPTVDPHAGPVGKTSVLMRVLQDTEEGERRGRD